ncbi:MAG: VWA domain-containing protein [Pyrinomonadaceae bacterium]|nr:VWA domain-containing protein [Pyrinomonadaceae bacterium]
MQRRLLSSFVFIILACVGIYQSQTTLPNPKATVTPKATPTPKVSEQREEDEPIRIETDLVILNIRVVDRMGRPITNLRKEDIKVYEDGVPQQIEYFSKELVPTNYAIVVDNSGSMRRQLEKVIESTRILIRSNLPDDETCIIRFISSDKIEILQDFTTDKALLEEALEKMFIEGGQTAVIDAVYLAAERVNEYEKAKDQYERKRRALILISDGEDRNSYYTEKQLFEFLKETDVQIYTIGFTSDLSKEGGFIRKSPREKAEALLKRLAEETGGKAYFPQSISELDLIAKDIAAELRTQYVVGYYPTNRTEDGRFIRIGVTVTDGPNKEKRIAITKAGRVAGGKLKDNPSLQPARPIQ